MAAHKLSDKTYIFHPVSMMHEILINVSRFHKIHVAHLIITVCFLVFDFPRELKTVP